MNHQPPISCHFQVDWGGTRTDFVEVTGLTIEHDVVEYRGSGNVKASTQKMPGMARYNPISLKRTILQGDNEFYDWIKTVKLNTVEKRDVVIRLLDEEHQPVMIWKIVNAWPMKLESPLLKSDVSEVTIETLVLAHEGIQIESE